MIEEIQKLKEMHDAVIVAHNYQCKEIQEIADYTGDSYALSKISTTLSNETIVFCGVRFMAETAKILSPEKKVLLPVLEAGCPMADMVDAQRLKKVKKEYPNVVVVCYVNSSAEVKAESDVCCTSSNAEVIVRNLDADQILFVPDQNLGSYIQKKVPDKEIILWEGYCNTHHRVTEEDVNKTRASRPSIKILMHPECRSSIVELADFVGSTAQIISYVNESKEQEFIIGTEMGILTALEKNNPDKKFYMLSPKLICPNMKKNRLEDVKDALRYGKHEIFIDDLIAKKARKSLMRMLDFQ